jgi:hypothetical protein
MAQLQKICRMLHIAQKGEQRVRLLIDIEGKLELTMHLLTGQQNDLGDKMKGSE